MRAIVLEKFGGPDSLVIKEIPEPEPRAVHVVIQVKAFGINHAEMHMRRGEWAKAAPVSCSGRCPSICGSQSRIGAATPTELETRSNEAAGDVATQLILKRASASRPSGDWSDDDYDVLAEGAVVGRIFNATASPIGTPWLWTLAFGQHEDRTPTHGYEPTREAAMASFAKSWRRE